MGKLSVPANINYPERGAAVQQYRWKAVDSSGVSRSGVYSAASEFEAAAFVRSNQNHRRSRWFVIYRLKGYSTSYA